MCVVCESGGVQEHKEHKMKEQSFDVDPAEKARFANPLAEE